MILELPNFNRVAIMQPYFLPYIGYWQLVNKVDCFVVYDDIKYTKKSWINRNNYLLNGRAKLFSLPLKHDSDYLDVRDRWLSDNARHELSKLVRKLNAVYQVAPAFDQVSQLVQQVFNYEDLNLIRFLMNSIESVCSFLDFSTTVVVSSTLGVPRELKGQDRVIAICEVLGASEYLNPIGGIHLYKPDVFQSRGVRLLFQRVIPFKYNQYEANFVPNLSVLDALMFLGKEGMNDIIESLEIFEL